MGKTTALRCLVCGPAWSQCGVGVPHSEMWFLSCWWNMETALGPWQALEGGVPCGGAVVALGQCPRAPSTLPQATQHAVNAIPGPMSPQGPAPAQPTCLLGFVFAWSFSSMDLSLDPAFLSAPLEHIKSKALLTHRGWFSASVECHLTSKQYYLWLL